MLAAYLLRARQACCIAALSLFPAHAVLAYDAMPAAGRMLSIEQLLSEPRLRQVRISPDGTRVSYLQQDGHSLQLKQLHVQSGQSTLLLQSLGPAQLTWSIDSTTIFLSFAESISAVNVNDGRAARIANLDRQSGQKLRMVDPSHPHHVLIDQFDSVSRNYRITRLSRDGTRETVYEGRKLLDFLIGADGKLSFAKWLDEKHAPVIVRRHDNTWTEVARCHRLDDCQLVTAAGNQLRLITAAAADRSALMRLHGRHHKPEMVQADPAGLAELRSVIVTPRSRRPLFALYESPQLRNVGLTPSAQRSVADIEKKFVDSQITIEASEDSPSLLLTERSARLSHERYWLYDSVGRKFAEILHDERAAGKPLDEDALALTLPLHYRASDGMMLHGYLTLPPGRRHARLPLMTIVHGGPWGRANAGHSPVVQLLANRGVAVFQPNFRSSVGYGQRYMLGGGGDFGNGRVQRDILDGVRWLLAQGIGDKDRLAIMGTSFGGYSTLLALSHTPQMFQFGMAIAPPSNFADTLENIVSDTRTEVPWSLRLKDLGVNVGNPLMMKKLHADSPVRNTGMLGKPLLIMAGGRDEMVAVASVIDYVARLQATNQTVSLMIDQEEGHNARKPMFQMAQMHLLAQMVHRHLGGPPAQLPSAALNDYLRQTMALEWHP